MTIKPATIDAYAATLPDGVQEIFQAVRETVLRLAPGAVEAIKYDMPSWRTGEGRTIYVGAWKNHLGLYPVYRGDTAFEALVAPYRDKKDTVRFVYRRPIPFDVIEAIVMTQLALGDAGAQGN